ncbi:hypothetical protein [Frigoribacterium sp. PhB24]|uniref:hypothetical protein n=1 Tax=Frigoribacterium sp. PhB24 TaxID=2485204 RepID=UPI000F4A324F|nr:hypothetical protein [Frigoribacterium sp. PhB24]ROS51296.1 hypothetical protein EDF50_1605 [Frigoribacterium sp. PhB24]
MKKLTRLAAIATAGLALTVGGVALPANAASNGYVYVVVRGTACGSTATTVKGIQVQNATIGWSLNWDRGDDIVYPQVRLGTANTLTLNLECYVGNRQVGYRYLPVTIRPTASNQTFWVG